MLLMIDNYDSFTYNLVQYFAELGEEVKVFRNDEISVDEIAKINPARICISPGPCSPAEAGISVATIQRYAGQIPILGVCLGHHGKTDDIHHTGVGVFKDLPNPFKVTRYHSLAIEKSSLPSVLEVTATSSDGEIMGVRHKELAVEGVQFHPESILSEHGHALLKNFLQAK
jgi:anthranilate synthase component II